MQRILVVGALGDLPAAACQLLGRGALALGQQPPQVGHGLLRRGIQHLAEASVCCRKVPLLKQSEALLQQLARRGGAALRRLAQAGRDSEGFLFILQLRSPIGQGERCQIVSAFQKAPRLRPQSGGTVAPRAVLGVLDSKAA